MTRNTPLTLRLGVASISLLVAVAVYFLSRIYPLEILVPFQSADISLAAHTKIFGSALSFFYTLALGLLIGACASSLSKAKAHCLLWIGLALCLELSQHPAVAQPVSSWLSMILSESIWGLFGPYWSRGVFDLVDLLAIVVGGSIALVLITYLPTENNDKNSS